MYGHWRRLGRTLTLAVLACIVGACTSPEPPYAAETVGVVQSKEPVPNGLSYRLTTGETFVAPGDSTYLGGSQPQVTELLLAGTKPRSWVYRLALQPERAGVIPAGCFYIGGDVRADSSTVYAKVHDAAVGDVTLAFPKAEVWTDGGFISSDVLAGTLTCINDHGQAFFHA
jgi:hypothetical protein